MKYLISAIFLIGTAFAEPRPMSITLIDDPDFGRLGIANALQLAGENIEFQWAGEITGPWNFLAGWGPASEDQYILVSFPGNWYTGHFYVKAIGSRSPTPLLAQKNGGKMKFPAVALEVVKK